MWRVCKHWREFRLNKNLSRALAVVVALGAVYTGTSWWLGQRVEAQYTSLLDRVAAQLEAGQVYVNEYMAGGVETPLGGYKLSGYGREKGLEALHHYTHVKCITVRL